LITICLCQAFLCFVFVLINKIILKLNTELSYARKALNHLIRNEGDKVAARKRVAWLEDRIEMLISAENQACILFIALIFAL
jgi:uncharacterized protein (UPF0216 family)